MPLDPLPFLFLYNRARFKPLYATLLGKESITAMTLRATAHILMGFGFLWIAIWATFGALWGAWLHSRLPNQLTDTDFLWQKEVLSSAHAHMNVMAMTVILAGLVLPKLRGSISPLFLKAAAWCHIASLPLFGFGLVAEGIWATSRGHLSWPLGFTSGGGILYILAMTAWAAYFFASLSSISFGLRR